MNRKQRRQRDKVIKKSKAQSSDLGNKLGLFDLLPDECLVCHKTFDKSNKEMVKTWNVVVREKERVVRVYCPSCWTKARNLLEELGINPDEKQDRQ